MNEFKTLREYDYHHFDDWGGVVSDDYRAFQRKYKNCLVKFCKNNGYELVNFSPNHYEFSCFIKNAEGKYIYFHISDVRYWSNEWKDNILIRLADSDSDYRGKSNHHTSLDKIDKNISNLFNLGVC